MAAPPLVGLRVALPSRLDALASGEFPARPRAVTVTPITSAAEEEDLAASGPTARHKAKRFQGPRARCRHKLASPERTVSNLTDSVPRDPEGPARQSFRAFSYLGVRRSSLGSQPTAHFSPACSEIRVSQRLPTPSDVRARAAVLAARSHEAGAHVLDSLRQEVADPAFDALLRALAGESGTSVEKAFRRLVARPHDMKSRK